MARYAVEFQCDGNGTWNQAGGNGENCGWFNYPRLRDNMTGNYIIVCGHCGHEHYRVIEKGKVTSIRHYAKYGEADRIWVPKDACSQERRQLGQVAQFRQLEAAGLATGGDE